MKHRYIAVSILSAVIILAFIGQTVLIMNRPLTIDNQIVTEPKATYRLEKINEINDKIINREVIEDTYFYYLGEDADLLSDVKQYNELTGMLIDEMTVMALDISVSMYMGMTGGIEAGIDYYAYTSRDYLKYPPEIHEYQQIIAHAALYRNCAELLYGNPKLAHFLGKGQGGSLGIWPKTFQLVRKDLYYDEELRAKELRSDLAEYFDLVDGLIIKIDDYRNKLIS